MRAAKETTRARVMGGVRLFLVGLSLFAIVPAARAAAVLDDALHQLQQRRLTSGVSEPLTVIVETGLPAVAADALRRHAFTPRLAVDGRFELQVEAARLSAFAAALPVGSLIRPSFPHEADVVSQGVPLTGAGDMHTLEANGAGVRIGIIDLGFASLAAAQSAGELPAALTVSDYTGLGTGGTNHGTQVAQIVHDMAPQAQLHLAKVATDVQLQQAVSDMIMAGVQVINHSVSWYGAAFYDNTGPICNSVDTAAASGIQWVNSAGNDRLRHYLGAFEDGNGNLRHEFTNGQDYNTVSLGANANLRLVLNWDAYPSTSVLRSVSLQW
ncbi:MAG: S8 family serine peptidase [Thiohalobacteraceae bacterium]